MFGNKSLPSRIYSYGANAPMENIDLVLDQMWKANGYRNNLAEVECDRRDKVDRILWRRSQTLCTVEKKISKLDEKIVERRDAIKKDHEALHLKIANDPQKVASISQLKRERDVLYKERQALRNKLFASKWWKNTQQEKINREIKAKDTKNRDASNLYWGNYLHVDQSMGARRSGPPPRFKRLDGGGHLAVQLQGGLSPAEALSGAGTLIRIVEGRVEVDGTLTHKTGIKRKLGNALCYFRIGSNEDGEPVFAKIPFTLHRPLPEDCRIKWVHLIRRRIGTKSDWLLQFVVSKKVWVKEDQATSGSVGLDLGWRLMEDGGLRVAVYRGSDGLEGDLALPLGWLSQMRRVEDIQSYRKKNFNDAIGSLSAWVKTAKKMPDWLVEQTKDLPLWKSQGRLAGLVLEWREKRVKGDHEIFFILEEWRKRDKHLYEFEANMRDQLQNRRQDIYRNFAAQLRRRYKTAKIINQDLRNVHAKPLPEDSPQEAAIKKHARDACLSTLIRCLSESMKEVVRMSGKNITKKHHECGSIQNVDGRGKFHTCTKCGETYDLDENAAKNILNPKAPKQGFPDNKEESGDAGSAETAA